MRFSFALLAGLCLAGTASADALIEAAQAKADETPLYAYEMVFSVDGLETQGTIDPSAPVGERIQVTSPSQDSWPDGFAEQITALDERTTGEIWCNDFAEMIPADAERTGETAEGIEFSFTPIPGDEADDMEEKIFKRLDASAVIDPDTAGLRSYRMSLPKSFKPNMMARINSFEMAVDCTPGPNGLTHIRTFTFNLAGSALGQDFGQTDQREILRLIEEVSPAG